MAWDHRIGGDFDERVQPSAPRRRHRSLYNLDRVEPPSLAVDPDITRAAKYMIDSMANMLSDSADCV